MPQQTITIELEYLVDDESQRELARHYWALKDSTQDAWLFQVSEIALALRVKPARVPARVAEIATARCPAFVCATCSTPFPLKSRAHFVKGITAGRRGFSGRSWHCDVCAAAEATEAERMAREQEAAARASADHAIDVLVSRAKPVDFDSLSLLDSLRLLALFDGMFHQGSDQSDCFLAPRTLPPGSGPFLSSWRLDEVLHEFVERGLLFPLPHDHVPFIRTMPDGLIDMDPLGLWYVLAADANERNERQVREALRERVASAASWASEEAISEAWIEVALDELSDYFDSLVDDMREHPKPDWSPKLEAMMRDSLQLVSTARVKGALKAAMRWVRSCAGSRSYPRRVIPGLLPSALQRNVAWALEGTQKFPPLARRHSIFGDLFFDGVLQSYPDAHWALTPEGFGAVRGARRLVSLTPSV